MHPMEMGRVETIRQLQADWRERGIAAQLDVVAGARHKSDGPIIASVLAFLRPLLAQYTME